MENLELKKEESEEKESSIKDKEESNNSIGEIEKRKNKLKSIFLGWIQDNYDKVFLIVLVIALIIRFLIFLNTMNQPLWYDTASYLATARQWGLGLNLHDIWYYRRGFFWPLFSAIFFKIGLGEVAIRFTGVLFSTGIVFVSYFLIKEMFNKKIALGVTISLAVSWILLFFTPRPLTDIPAAFFILTSLLFFWKGYIKNQGNKFIYISGIFFALTVMTRMQSLMFAPSFLIAVFLKEKFRFLKNKYLWISLLLFLIVLSPNLYVYSMHYGNPIKDILTYNLGIGGAPNSAVSGKNFSSILNYIKDLPYEITSNLSTHSYYYFITRIFFIVFLTGIFFFFIDLVLGFDKIFKNKELQTKLFILSWILIPFLVLGYLAPAVEQRYMTATLPFLFLIPIFLIFSTESLILQKTKLSKRTVLIILFLILIIFLVPNYVWGKQLIEFKKTSYAEVKEAGLWLKENTDPNAIILSDSEPQIQYYSGRSTYSINRNESDFEDQIKELKPDYLILSIYEQSPDWAFSYPEAHPEVLKAIYGIPPNQQANTVIYKFEQTTEPLGEKILEAAEKTKEILDSKNSTNSS